MTELPSLLLLFPCYSSPFHPPSHNCVTRIGIHMRRGRQRTQSCMFDSSLQLELGAWMAIVRQRLCVKVMMLLCRKIPQVLLLSQLSCLNNTYSDCASSWVFFFLILRGDLVQDSQAVLTQTAQLCVSQQLCQRLLF